MAIPRGQRFEVPFRLVFADGALMMGEVSAVTEFQSREDRARGRQARHEVDEVTGLRLYRCTVNDPAAVREADKAVTVLITAEVQPVPPEGVEVAPGMVVRPVEFEGMSAEPRVTGTGEYKRLSYVLRATGMRAPSGGRSTPRPPLTAERSGPDAGKSAGSGDGKAVA